MHLAVLKAVRITIVAVAIIILGRATFGQALTESSKVKPQLNLIPDEIRADHFVNSVPSHKQFVQATPISTVINFDTEFDKFSSSVVNNHKEVASTPMTSLRGNSIRQSLPQVNNDGIFLVKYTACFGQNCSQGQFVYLIDSRKVTSFENQTQKKIVEIEITQNSIKPKAALVDQASTINFKNAGEVNISVRSDPPDQSNYFPPLNSPEIKPGESFSIPLDRPGLYLYHIQSNPKIKGEISVQNN